LSSVPQNCVFPELKGIAKAEDRQAALRLATAPLAAAPEDAGVGQWRSFMRSGSRRRAAG